MKPIKTEATNCTLIAPGCGDLPVERWTDTEGHPWVEGTYELDEEELKYIEETGRIHINLMGNTQPPIMNTILPSTRLENRPEESEGGGQRYMLTEKGEKYLQEE